MSVATLERSLVAHPDKFFIDGQWSRHRAERWSTSSTRPPRRFSWPLEQTFTLEEWKMLSDLLLRFEKAIEW